MRPGMTERQVARQVLNAFEELGDTDPWAIVASGPNAAMPHHFSSDKKLARGEAVLLDLGASTGGFRSATTPTSRPGAAPPAARRARPASPPWGPGRRPRTWTAPPAP